jgi:hypothetical protein
MTLEKENKGYKEKLRRYRKASEALGDINEKIRTTNENTRLTRSQREEQIKILIARKKKLANV